MLKGRSIYCLTIIFIITLKKMLRPYLIQLFQICYKSLGIDGDNQFLVGGND